MLKALGLASTEQREKYKELKSASNRCQGDIDALKTVMEGLRTAYDTHKSDYALGRYEALKKMVKETGCRYESVMENRRKDPDGGSNRRSGERQEIKAFAARASFIARMSSSEMAVELERMNQRLDQLRRQSRAYRDALEKLNSDYQCSKKQLPPARYYALKDMVKVATRTDP